jgi:hypothetical protein
MMPEAILYKLNKENWRKARDNRFRLYSGGRDLT